VYNHIHCHTEYSPLDGLSTCTEIMARAAELGSVAVAITDHGACPGHPSFQRAADEAGIKPLFGMEGYFAEDRHQKVRDNRHVILLAEDDRGLRDLWAVSTEAYLSGHYHRPRLDWDLLERYGSHLIMTTACLGGIVADFFKTGDYRRALGTLKRLQSIFGDRLYLELCANEQPEQVTYNKLLAEAGAVLGISLVATSDGHYPSAEQAADHHLWMACRTSPSNDDYWKIVHMQAEDEVRDLLSYLDPIVVDHAIASTAEIADRCTARVSGETDPPVFLGSYTEDSRRLIDLCIEAVETARVPLRAATRRQYLDQLEYEWNLVARKRLSGCYLIVDDFCAWARSEDILLGPGRGSAAGSIMSYLTGITAIDPLAAGLMFERFLTPGRTALPDFDLDLPSSVRPKVWDHLVSQYGESRILRVGTHVRYRSKGILNKLFSVMERELPVDSDADSRVIANVIDEAESHTAGLGLSWPELMDQAGAQLDPMMNKYMRVFQYAEKLVGRLHTHGKHPGGVVISTGDSFEGKVPLWNTTEDPTQVSQWDFRDVELLGQLKLDFLTLRNLDTIQTAINLIGNRTGVRLDPPTWQDEYADPQVWEEIGTGHTLGMFQVETTLGQQACREMQPGSLSELADLTTYVRPGPRNSGMAAAYIQRRAGKQEVTYPHPLLEPHLQRSYGVMLYQEDILTAVRVLAGYDGAEADAVRKVLGKKLIEKIDEAGRQFIDRCIERGLDKDEVTALWEIMAEFGRYAFNRAHGYSYATLAYWTAWLKTHYPVEMFTALLSTVDMERIPEFITDARRLGVAVLPPEINSAASGFEPEGLAVRYGMGALWGVGPAAVNAIIRGQPYTSYDQVLAAPGVNKGIVLTLARAGALDALVPSRRSLIEYLAADKAGDLTRCVNKDETVSNHGLPCHYDWDNEPPPPSRISPKTGKHLKVIMKPPPKICTRACRHYTPPPTTGIAGAANGEAPRDYTPAELWRLEQDIFGCWLDDAMFARLDELNAGFRQASVNRALRFPRLKPGVYDVPGVHNGMRPALTRRGSTMWWLDLATEVSNLDIAVFSPRNDNDPDLSYAVRRIPAGTLIIAEIAKGRYWNGMEWRDSLRLESVRRLT